MSDLLHGPSYLRGVAECETKMREAHQKQMTTLGQSHEKDLAYQASTLREITQAYEAAHSEVESLKGLLRSAETDVRRLRLQLERTGSDHLDEVVRRVAALESVVDNLLPKDKGLVGKPFSGGCVSEPYIGPKQLRHTMDKG